MRVREAGASAYSGTHIHIWYLIFIPSLSYSHRGGVVFRGGYPRAFVGNWVIHTNVPFGKKC